MINWLIEASLFQAIIALVFLVFLRNTKHFQFVRMFLLIGVSLSLFISIIHIPVEIAESTNETAYLTRPLIDSNDQAVAQTFDYKLSASYLPLWKTIYFTISSLLLIKLIYQLYLMFIKINRNNKISLNGNTYIIESRPASPYSFLNYIFVSSEFFANRESYPELIRHEQIHISRKHSLDILLLEFIKIALWISPFLWLIEKWVRRIHEYEADHLTASEFTLEVYVDKLLKECQSTQTNNLAHAFSKKSIKTRLIMLTNKKKSRLNIALKSILAFTITAFAFALMSVHYVTAPAKYTVFVDAGHGGNDLGAGYQGVYEKDFTLHIAKKIQGKSTGLVEYRLTRKSDSPINLGDRISQINEQTGDLLISIHIGFDNNNSHSGITAYYSAENEHPEKSKQLATLLARELNGRVSEGPFLLIRKSKMAAVHLEIGVLNDPTDFENLHQKQFIEDVTSKINLTVQKYLQEK
jgi:N-acetylmuramoyl-L-alanine amidase